MSCSSERESAVQYGPAPEVHNDAINEFRRVHLIFLAPFGETIESVRSELEEVSEDVERLKSHVAFVNSWLLDKLRSSLIEFMELASFAAERLDILDYPTWYVKALSLWEDDGAGMEMSICRTEKTRSCSESSSFSSIFQSYP